MYRDAVILTNAKCNLDCPHCSRWFFQRDYAGYHLSLEETSNICKRINELGIRFRFVRLTGGEPTLWKHLTEGCKIIKEANIADKVLLMSNCSTIDKTIELLNLGYIDEVRTNLAVEEKNRHNAAGVEKLKNEFPDKISITMDVHVPHPFPPIKDSLPAGWANGKVGCTCNHVTFLGDKVFQCANEHDRCRFVGENPKPINLSNDWPSHYNDPKKFNRPMCSVCLVNPKVKPKIPKRYRLFEN